MTNNNITIAHIINPFVVGKDSDLFTAQPVTFETMRTARNAAAKEVQVELYAAFYPEDETIVPDYFSRVAPLNRSILDINIAGKPEKPRKLPLLKDILDRLYWKSSADYFIYTNVDIALMPEFYLEVKKYILKGYDGFVINRRTISTRYHEVKDIPMMIKETRKRGEKHPGYDCFVFQRSAYPYYQLGTACIGANWVGRVLIADIMAFSRRFNIFKDLRLTFHIGDDRGWLAVENNAYNNHNESQLIMIFENLLGLKDVKNKETLKNFYSYNLKNREERTRLPLPLELVKEHAPEYRLADKPDRVYHSEFRYSTSWEGFERQLIRQDPIFIVGYPRSGTTLVQALIATQDRIVSFYETHFFSIVRRFIRVKNDRLVMECIDRVVEKIRERLAFSKNAEEHIKKLVQTTGLSVKMLFEIIVLDNLIARGDDKNLKEVRWMEKTPAHVLNLDIIFRFYPKAKVIYVMRDPEKAIISRRQSFSFNNEVSWPLERHIHQWLETVWTIEKFEKSHPGSVLIVKLEDIAGNTIAEMHKICGFLGITLNAGRLSRHKQIAGTLVYPWETWKDSAGKPVSSTLALRKYRYLTGPERAKLLAEAENELRKYGYYSVPREIKRRIYLIARENMSKLKERVNVCREKLFNALQDAAPPEKTFRGKINLDGQSLFFYGQHRSGWKYAVGYLQELHNPEGVLLDAFIERTFAWRAGETTPRREPWVGFIHVPPHIPEWFQGQQSNRSIFKSSAWQESFQYCKGLYTLSRYHRDFLENTLDIPVNHLLFPTETPGKKWSWENFAANKDKKIIQIGWWLRKIHSIFQLPLPPGKYKKVFLKVSYFDWEDLIKKEREILVKQGTFRDEMYDTAETAGYLPNDVYDRMLTENIVFLNLYDSSANNTIIECIARNTPILVNPLAAVKEYLGESYPFYFDSLEEAVEKVQDDDLVYKTHRYLANHPITEKLTGEYFLKSFEESEIYKNL